MYICREREREIKQPELLAVLLLDACDLGGPLVAILGYSAEGGAVDRGCSGLG